MGNHLSSHRGAASDHHQRHHRVHHQHHEYHYRGEEEGAEEEGEERHLFPTVAPNHISSPLRRSSSPSPSSNLPHNFSTSYISISPPPPPPPPLLPATITTTTTPTTIASEPTGVPYLEFPEQSPANPPNSTVFHGLFAPTDQLTSSPSITSSVIAHGSSAEQSSVASIYRLPQSGAMPEHTFRFNGERPRDRDIYYHHNPPPSPTATPSPPASTYQAMLEDELHYNQSDQHHRHHQRRHRNSRRDPYPRRHAPRDRDIMADPQLPPYLRSLNTLFSGNRRNGTANDLGPIRRRRQSRLGTLRHSIAAPISNLLGHNPSPEMPAPISSSHRRSATSSQVDPLLGPFDGTAGNPTEMARNPSAHMREAHGRSVSGETESSIVSSNASSLTLTGMGDRPSAGPRSTPTLARLLAIAASAMSSQPGDHNTRVTVVNNQPPMGDVSINDSLRTIIRSIQRQHANDGNEGGSRGRRASALRNINYVRAFLVDNNNPSRPLNPHQHLGTRVGSSNTSRTTANRRGYSGRFDDSSLPFPPPELHDLFDASDDGWDEDDIHMTGTTSTRTRSSLGSSARSRSGSASDSGTGTGSGSGSQSITLVIVGVRTMGSTAPSSRRHSRRAGADEAMPRSNSYLSRFRDSAANFARSGHGFRSGRSSSGAITNANGSSGVTDTERRGFRLPRTRFALRSRWSNTTTTPRDNGAQAVQHDDQRILDASLNREMGLYDSPPGPAPPPTTPADPSFLSAAPSHSVTPRRLSTASNTLREVQENGTLGNDARLGDGGGNTQTRTATPIVRIRQRRRSDSEAERHRGLGSGSSRRHGVVEPDDSEGDSAGRSWLIYVVGANLSEVNPALLMPSLFTNSPTYEDMLMLSSMMGQVKTPVASESDVAGAGGLYAVVEVEGQLVAEIIRSNGENGSGGAEQSTKSHSGNEASSSPPAAEPQSTSASTPLPPPQRILVQGERCLVCLSDYEVGEAVRRLTNCKHIFHQQCIDQWLTTGRNSCPMCREQGVSEKPVNTDNTLRFPGGTSGYEAHA